MNYIVSDIGNWCSILGFIITIITFFVAANVNAKINKIQKSENDKSYFNKKLKPMMDDLNAMKSYAERSGDINGVFGIQQHSKIKNVITVVRESWDVLLLHENVFIKKIKIHSWNKKMKKILDMYNGYEIINQRELVSFLVELITFLEKESINNV